MGANPLIYCMTIYIIIQMICHASIMWSFSYIESVMVDCTQMCMSYPMKIAMSCYDIMWLICIMYACLGWHGVCINWEVWGPNLRKVGSSTRKVNMYEHVHLVLTMHKIMYKFLKVVVKPNRGGHKWVNVVL